MSFGQLPRRLQSSPAVADVIRYRRWVRRMNSAAALVRRCWPGEDAGIMPDGFDINNSPTQFLAQTPKDRPVVLLSSTGTKLCCEAARADAVFLACLRNYESAAAHLAGNFSNVAVIGAGSRGEFREEDQMCCAWVAERLMQFGYAPRDRNTLDLVRRWSGKPVDALAVEQERQLSAQQRPTRGPGIHFGTRQRLVGSVHAGQR